MPFPVQVVARVVVADGLSQGRLTTEYCYHHGYWDGEEREFRGFGLVEQFDTESFDTYQRAAVPEDKPWLNDYFSPPTQTKTWFHLGPVEDESREWHELDWARDYCQADPQLLKHAQEVTAFVKALSRDKRRDALRALRGSILRTELYALDGSEREERPYTVTEHSYSLKEIIEARQGLDDDTAVFFPHSLAQRTTQWERGDDPLTRFSYTTDYDDYGQPRRQIQIACPRGWRSMSQSFPPKEYLATLVQTAFTTNPTPMDAASSSHPYIADRVASSTSYEITGNLAITVPDIAKLTSTDADLSMFGYSRSFYDGIAFQGLPNGQIERYGALVRTETLVLNRAILDDAYGTGHPVFLDPQFDPSGSAWPAEYPQQFRQKFPKLAGYVYDANLGYLAITERRQYDFHIAGTGKRGLLIATLDPLGHQSTITGYEFALLPAGVKDAAGLETKAEYNRRVLQPIKISDPNDNYTEVSFSPMGLPEKTWVKGKNGEGDQIEPSITLTYDFLAFAKRGDPVSVKTIRRVHHDTEKGPDGNAYPAPDLNETITTSEYSDGFGRLLQTRTQAEDYVFADGSKPDPDLIFGNDTIPLEQTGRGGAVKGYPAPHLNHPRVVVSGWQRYDNKGRVVEKFEPSFDYGWDYAAPSETPIGKKVRMFYDPRGQVIRTLNPDGSEQRVMYGVPGTIATPDVTKPNDFEPTPWETYTYDANDLAALSTGPDGTGLTMRAPSGHHHTPASIVIDGLGRAIQAVERNGPNPQTDWYTTRSTYDIRANLLTVTDALNRLAFTHVYDLANRPLWIESIDAGIRRSVPDAAGNVIEGRDSKGSLGLRGYDVMNRPTHLWARDGTGQAVSLREQIFYGDDPASGLTQAHALADNLLGTPYQHYDEAGLLSFERYDFKGNLLEKSRRVISDTAILDVFDPPPAKWDVQAFRVDWQPPGRATLQTHAAGLLDPPVDAYVTSVGYDALNRIKTMRYPADVTAATRHEGGVRTPTAIEMV